MRPRSGATASVGVVGGGIFGVTAAWEIAVAGFAVTLYEKRDDILGGTTSNSFFRVHRGYHYPRDFATAIETRDGFQSFAETFSGAFAAPTTHHYAIAAENSQTTVDQFERHCRETGLRLLRKDFPGLVPGSVVASFEVHEAYYDPTLLRKVAWEGLSSAGVRVELGSSCAVRDIDREHDFIVVAAYGSLNEILLELGCESMELLYELCEVPVVHTPGMGPMSLVVLDGPFVSVAPQGTHNHALYDVVHSVHASFVGSASPGPGFEQYPRDFVDVAALPPGVSRAASILASAQRFVGPLDGAVHVGSYFAERVVSPHVNATDARPTVISWASPTVISILSGKVSTAIDSAHRVVCEIRSRACP